MNIDKNTIEKIRKIFPHRGYGELETDAGFLVPINYINEIIDDILSRCEELELEFKEWKQYVDDNCKAIPVSEQVCISESDFH